MRFKQPEGQLAQWLEELSQFDITIQHRPGLNMAMQMDFQGFWKKDSVIAIRQELIWLIFHVQVASIALGYMKAGNVLKVMLMMLCHLPSEQFILQMMWMKNQHHKTRKMNNPLPG